MYACVALVLTSKMLAFTFAPFAVLVLAGGWIDYYSYGR
jgi:predicted Na+-dependent transporter